jgi:BMFP domain-containing protein YqiC
MCSPAPVVNRYGQDVAAQFLIPAAYNVPGPGGVFLGSVGDQAHATRKSSHNCGAMQEDGDYADEFAHAWDCRPKTAVIGYALVKATLADDRVRYVLYADHGWKPDGTFEDITDNEQWDLDHDTFHVSFLPGTHNDTRPFFTDQGADDVTAEDLEKIRDIVQNNTEKVRDAVQNNADTVVAALVAAFEAKLDEEFEIQRRIIWKANGKTKAEIDELEAAIKAGEI